MRILAAITAKEAEDAARDHQEHACRVETIVPGAFNPTRTTTLPWLSIDSARERIHGELFDDVRA